MKKPMLIVAVFFCSVVGIAQTKIDGIYNPQRKTYIAHANLIDNFGKDPFDIDEFNHGMGVVENTETTKMGVIDSTGAVVVPMIYTKIEEIERTPGMFIFYTQEEMGIVNYLGNETIKISKTGTQSRIRSSINKDCVFVEQGNKIGLINIRKSQIIIPIEYDVTAWYQEKYERSRRFGYYIELNDYSAIAKKGNQFYVFNLNTGQRGGPYVDVMRTGQKSFFVKDEKGNAKIIDLDFQTVKKIPGSIIDAYEEYVISQRNDKYGVYHVDGTEVFPCIYDDVYFINDDAVWVKKNDAWAMLSFDGEKQTPFEYLEIEKINDLFLENLLAITHLDTTQGNLFIQREYAGINDCPSDLKQLIYGVQQMTGSKRLFNTYLDYNGSANFSYAKKANGYHFTYPPLQEVEPEAWDMVYYVPDCIDPYGMKGYKKGNKFGVEKDAVKYEGILYDSLELTMNCDNGCVIARGMIMSNSVDYTGNKGCYFRRTIPLVEYKVK